MGKIELDGSQVEELREALSSAFTEDNLKQMLRLRLNWRWDEIKKGETYEDRLFNLIELAESEGRAEQLIISAARQQYNNPKLQKFVETYAGNLIEFDSTVLPTNSLLNLLSILKKANNFQGIAGLVKCILPMIETHRPKDVKDLEEPNLSSWFKAFRVLKLLLEDYPGLEQHSNLLTFVEHLSKESKIDNSIKQQLNEWLHKIDPNRNRQQGGAEQISLPASGQLASGTLQAYLMITVNPEKKTQVRAIASLLCISPTGVRKEIPVHLNPESNERGVLCSWKKLPDTLEKFIKKSIEYELEKPANKLGCVSYDLTIEVFLASEYLCEPIDCWKIKDDFDNPVCLGSKHPLVVRSYDRVAKPSLNNALSKSWHNTKKFLEQNPDAVLLQQQIHHLDKIDCNKLRLLQEELKQKIGLKVICALPESKTEMVNFFREMLMSGIPIAFWTRSRELPSCEVMAGIDGFLTIELLRNSYELLEKVRQKRVCALNCEMPEKHWGSHLSVLWDDWERMPTLESF